MEQILAHPLLKRNKSWPSSSPDCIDRNENADRKLKNQVRKGAAVTMLIETLHRCDRRKLATAFRQWSCETGKIQALGSQKEFAKHMANQLQQTRSKFIALKSHLCKSGLLSEDDRRQFSLAPSSIYQTPESE